LQILITHWMLQGDVSRIQISPLCATLPWVYDWM